MQSNNNSIGMAAALWQCKNIAVERCQKARNSESNARFNVLRPKLGSDLDANKKALAAAKAERAAADKALLSISNAVSKFPVNLTEADPTLLDNSFSTEINDGPSLKAVQSVQRATQASLPGGQNSTLSSHYAPSGTKSKMKELKNAEKNDLLGNKFEDKIIDDSLQFGPEDCIKKIYEIGPDEPKDVIFLETKPRSISEAVTKENCSFDKKVRLGPDRDIKYGSRFDKAGDIGTIQPKPSKSIFIEDQPCWYCADGHYRTYVVWDNGYSDCYCIENLRDRQSELYFA